MSVTVASTSLPSAPRWVLPVSALALSAIGSSACLLAAGPMHGVLFGACLTAVLLTPALASADSDWRILLLVIAAATIGAAAGPMVALLQGELNGRLFSTLFAVVASLTVALAGVASLLALLRLPSAVATTLVTVAALLWLAWPIWLSHWLAGNDALVAALSPAHPLLTIDAAIVREGGVSWLEHRLMYAKLTVLGQHVFTRPSPGVAAAVLWHGAIGVACLVIVVGAQIWTNRRAKRREIPSDQQNASRQDSQDSAAI